MSECVVVAMAAALAVGLIPYFKQVHVRIKPYPQPLFQTQSVQYCCLLNRLFLDSSKSHTNIVQVAKLLTSVDLITLAAYLAKDCIAHHG